MSVLDLAVSTLVHKLSDALQVRVPICNIWLHNLKHFARCFSELDEHARVDLEKSEELKGLALLGINFVDSAKT